MVDFQAKVGRWTRQVKERSEEALRAIALAAEARVKELTPVKTGNLRANWSVVTSADAVAKASGAPRSEAATARLGQKIYLINPVEYARRVEYGFTGADALGRQFNQAGAGMVAQTMAELPGIAKKIVREIKTS